MAAPVASDEMDVRTWFDDEDLEECPRCRKRTAIKNPTPLGGWVVCLTCGIVGVRADKSVPPASS